MPRGGLSRRTMKILSLDTAMGACSAAVIDTGSRLPMAAAYVQMERGHAEALPPMVAGVMKTADLRFSQIDRIAVTIGPGTFTGVRIGIAFARGLAQATGIPVVGIDTLSAIAANEAAVSPLLVVSDARNDEVYAAFFDASRKQLIGPHITSAKDVAARTEAGTIVLGTAARGVQTAGGRTDLVLSSAGDLPVAARFATLAATILPGPLPLPVYLRAPDVKPQQAPLRQISEANIVRAGQEAADLLSRLHGEVFDDGWSVASFTDLLGSPGADAIIALEGGEPLGFLVTRSAADEAEVISIGTRPFVQRRGVARLLLARQLNTLAASGLRTVFLEVATSNLAAQKLYASFDFREAGRRKGYYKRDSGTEDAIILRCELGQ
jgi:tRNA threonylcarbamoyladenosine biosynthesis protein TsaB